MPLEAAEVGLALSRLGGLEGLEEAADVRVVVVASAHPDHGEVGLPVGFLLAGDRDPLVIHGQQHGGHDPDQSHDRGDDQPRPERGDGGPSAGPLGDPLEPRMRPGEDRLAVEPASQVLGHLLRRRVAEAGVLRQALQADDLEVVVDPFGPLRRGTGSFSITVLSRSRVVSASNGGHPVRSE